ncbi:N utilization substance protein B [Halolactibacillus halophilus]|uniref:Transcription antitermination protein NusB n=1 Tax=Halolactibacillus halophilus TaxID=306540 RepID=A0A1I5SUY5_9BACI|nr:transcription antitermination factor NusB [Halolactibacillus halophilus]GEM02733.1 N utilization substance protein B [Halolactibacillus halophilus]SFP74498.1 N utilization substance protein B [Halolactibacillus halophilus]
MKRRLAREKAFQVLFSLDNEDFDVKEAITLSMEDEEVDDFLSTLIHGVVENKETIDNKIDQTLEKWSFKRLATVEKTLLRLATYEIDSTLQTPIGVAINEAVELAKVYGDEKSGKFVNGVLSKLYK